MTKDVSTRYEPAIQKLAYRLCPTPNELDVLAHDRFDYVSMLRERATYAMRKYSECERRAPEPGFVLSALWNETASCLRRRTRRPRFLEYYETTERACPWTRIGKLEATTEARRAIGKLRQCLSPPEMEMLEAWAVAGGTGRGATRLLTGSPKRKAALEAHLLEIVARARDFLVSLGVGDPEILDTASIQDEGQNMATRQELEQAAEHFGIAYTNYTYDGELEAAIAEREGAEAEIPSCYGIMWAANADPGCKVCQIAEQCLTTMVHKTMPERAQGKGRAMSAEEYAEDLDIPLVSAEFAMQYRQTAAKQAAADIAGPPAPVDAGDEKETEVVSAKKAQPKRGAKARPKKAPVSEPGESLETRDPPEPRSASPALDLGKVPEDEIATPAEVQAPPRSRKSSGQRGRVKTEKQKPAPKKTNSVSQSPAQKKPAKKTPAKRGKKATLPTIEKQAAKPGVGRKKVKARPADSRPWGEHTYLSRWTRERERSPAVAAVPIQQTLRRIFNGNPYQTQCLKGHWLYQGKQYPTLYAVTMAITGGSEFPVMRNGQVVPGKVKRASNWSAPRFWNLPDP